MRHLSFVGLRATAAALVVGVLLGAGPATAVPHFARRYGVDCRSCHVVPPKLNRYGEAFLARGYRMPPAREATRRPTTPVSAWLTARLEDNVARDFTESFVNRVELVSSGPMRATSHSYFVEWRAGSLETRANGSLRDRSGRIEDAFVNFQLSPRDTVRVGQFRALNQVDVSRRLSISEPLLLSGSLAGKRATRARITGLRAFAPAGRSPGVAFQRQWSSGSLSSDGLFSIATLPFVGELSLPITGEAGREASFELKGPPKGVFLETFYRRSLDSLGVHALIDDDRWLISGVGTWNRKDLYLTVGLGFDGRDGSADRTRYGAELEYVPRTDRELQPGAGVRIEHIEGGARPALIPFAVLSAPNRLSTALLQLEYRSQTGADVLSVDLSWVF